MRLFLAGLRVARLCAWVGWLGLIGLAIALRAPTPGTFCFVWLVLTAPFLWPHRWDALRFAGLALTVVLFVAVALGQTIREVQARVDTLAAHTDALSDLDRGGIYALGIAMALGGHLVGYPEAAREQLLMYSEGPSVRQFEGDFAMASPRLKNAIAAALHGGRIRVVFDEMDPMRLRLALNPFIIEARGGGDSVAVTGRVDVRYPRHSRVALFTLAGETFSMEEGLFAALQDCGWLHPYVAEWHWTVRTDAAPNNATSADVLSHMKDLQQFKEQLDAARSGQTLPSEP